MPHFSLADPSTIKTYQFETTPTEVAQQASGIQGRLTVTFDEAYKWVLTGLFSPHPSQPDRMLPLEGTLSCYRHGVLERAFVGTFSPTTHLLDSYVLSEHHPRTCQYQIFHQGQLAVQTSGLFSAASAMVQDAYVIGYSAHGTGTTYYRGNAISSESLMSDSTSLYAMVLHDPLGTLVTLESSGELCIDIGYQDGMPISSLVYVVTRDDEKMSSLSMRSKFMEEEEYLWRYRRSPDGQYNVFCLNSNLIDANALQRFIQDIEALLINHDLVKTRSVPTEPLVLTQLQFSHIDRTKYTRPVCLQGIIGELVGNVDPLGRLQGECKVVSPSGESISGLFRDHDLVSGIIETQVADHQRCVFKGTFDAENANGTLSVHDSKVNETIAYSGLFARNTSFYICLSKNPTMMSLKKYHHGLLIWSHEGFAVEGRPFGQGKRKWTRSCDDAQLVLEITIDGIFRPENDFNHLIVDKSVFNIVETSPNMTTASIITLEGPVTLSEYNIYNEENGKGVQGIEHKTVTYHDGRSSVYETNNGLMRNPSIHQHRLIQGSHEKKTGGGDTAVETLIGTFNTDGKLHNVNNPRIACTARRLTGDQLTAVEEGVFKHGFLVAGSAKKILAPHTLEQKTYLYRGKLKCKEENQKPVDSFPHDDQGVRFLLSSKENSRYQGFADNHPKPGRPHYCFSYSGKHLQQITAYLGEENPIPQWEVRRTKHQTLVYKALIAPTPKKGNKDTQTTRVDEAEAMFLTIEAELVAWKILEVPPPKALVEVVADIEADEREAAQAKRQEKEKQKQATKEKEAAQAKREHERQRKKEENERQEAEERERKRLAQQAHLKELGEKAEQARQAYLEQQAAKQDHETLLGDVHPLKKEKKRQVPEERERRKPAQQAATQNDETLLGDVYLLSEETPMTGPKQRKVAYHTHLETRPNPTIAGQYQDHNITTWAIQDAGKFTFIVKDTSPLDFYVVYCVETDAPLIVNQLFCGKIRVDILDSEDNRLVTTYFYTGKFYCTKGMEQANDQLNFKHIQGTCTEVIVGKAFGRTFSERGERLLIYPLGDNEVRVHNAAGRRTVIQPLEDWEAQAGSTVGFQRDQGSSIARNPLGFYAPKRVVAAQEACAHPEPGPA